MLISLRSRRLRADRRELLTVPARECAAGPPPKPGLAGPAYAGAPRPCSRNSLWRIPTAAVRSHVIARPPKGVADSETDGTPPPGTPPGSAFDMGGYLAEAGDGSSLAVRAWTLSRPKVRRGTHPLPMENPY